MRDSRPLGAGKENVQCMVEMYRELPKELFLSQMLNDFHSDESVLFDLRHKLFNEVKCLEEFPYPPSSELKKRKNTRSGESVAMKLGYDIYILTSVIDGAPFDDMKDMLSISKLSSQNQSTCVNSPLHSGSQNANQQTGNYSEAELSLLRNLVASVQADIVQLKESHRSLREEYSKDLKLVKTDINTVKSELKSFMETSRKNADAISELRQSFDQLNDEKSNGVASIRSEMKQMKSDIKESDDTNALEIMTVKNKLKDMNRLEKRVSKLEHKIQDSKSVSCDKADGNCAQGVQCVFTNGNNSNRTDSKDFTAEMYIPKDNGNQTMSSDCKAASDTDIGYNDPQIKNALVRSPTTGLLKRLPVSNIRAETVVHMNMVPNASPPPTPSHLPTNGDLISFSPSSKASKTHKPVDSIEDVGQGIRPHVFSESDVQETGAVPRDILPGTNFSCRRQTPYTISPPRGNVSLRKSLAQGDRTGGYNQNHSSGAVTDTRNTSGIFPINTVITPMGTVVTDKRIENESSYECPVYNRYAVLQDKMYSETLNINNPFLRPSGANEQQDSIPVHISSRSENHVTSNNSDKRLASSQDRYDPRSHPEPEFAQYGEDDSDDDFEMHIRRRSRRFYIGGYTKHIWTKAYALCHQERCPCDVD